MKVWLLDGTVEYKTVYDIYNFPYECLYDVGTVRTKRGITYYNTAGAYDIETTTILSEKPYGFMYHWQLCLLGNVVFGRTWNEFLEFLSRLQKTYELNENRRIVLYVHNLAYEFQFFRNFLNITECFARKKRIVIKCSCDYGIEFRCSYFLSNMSLEKFCQKTEGVIHGKNVGMLDYKVIRTCTTTLSEKELSYNYNDVMGLYECIKTKMKDDTIISIPLTSTGYVRRHFRQRVNSNFQNKKIFLKNKVNSDIYIELKEAFRGGNTHANYLYTDEVIEGVHGHDIKSSYPASMMLNKFPQKFIKSNTDIEKHIFNGYAVLFRARYINISSKIPHTLPYIPISKCRNLSNYINDNGRILRADCLDITLTDIDYKIIKSSYNYEKLYVKDVYIAKYDYLPKEFRETLLEAFRLKCELDGIPGKEYEYAKEKNKINSAYGMMVTDIAMPDIIYDGEWCDSIPVNVEESLNKYYNNRNSFLSYQHGVWVTAHSRMRLQKAINMLGDNIIYSDTDSCKDISPNSCTIFDILNKEVMREIDQVDIKPVVHIGDKNYIIGIWEDEGVYSEFKTLGAKKYCYKKDGKYTITVAGLSKKKGSEYINEHGIESFEIGTIFTDSGRLTATYNDVKTPYYITVNGEKILTASNIALVPTTYELGVTDTYFELFSKKKKKMLTSD